MVAWMSKLVLLVIALTSLGGCDDPCEKLQKKVCEDPVYYKANKRHCDLLSESARRDALPKEFCESILDAISKR